MSTHDRTISLEERMDAQLREFGYVTAKEEKSRKWDNARTGVAATVAAGSGGYLLANKGRNAVINKAGVVDDYGNMVARKGMYQDAGKKLVAEGKAGAAKAGKAAAESGKQVARKGLGKTGRKLIKAGGQEGGLLRKAGQTLTKAGRSFSAGEVQAITHLAERIALLELEAEDELKDFAREQEDRSWQRGAAGVAGGAAVGGAAYGGIKARNKVIGSYGSANQSAGKMVPRKGMYAAAGQDVLAAGKAKAGVLATDGMAALKKAKGNVVARFAKKTAGMIS